MQLRKMQMSPNMLMLDFIGTLTFIDIGTVKTVYGKGERIDVLLPYKRPDKQEDLLRGVELLQYGNSTAKVFIPPKTGDSVIVLAPRSAIIDTIANAVPEERVVSHYNPIGYKALLLYGSFDEEPKLDVEITEAGGFNISTKEEVTINGHLTIAGASS